MSFTAAWLRVDLRRRWRSWAVLALLVAVASGTVLASVAGARRAESALGRLAAQTLPATAVVLPNEPGFDWDAVRAMPEVETLTTFLLGLEFPVTDDATGEPAGLFGFPFGDAEWGTTIDRPVILSGRMSDPASAEEVVATPRYMERTGRRLGDTFTARLFTPEQVAAVAGPTGAPPEPAGPTVRLRIVGVGLSTWGHDAPGEPGGMQLSPGFAQQYRANFYDEATSYANALVRLHGGEAALPEFQRRLAEVTGRSDIDVWNSAAILREEQRGIAFEARSLLVLAAAALVAALFLVGQAIARYTTATLADLRLLRAPGLTPREAARVAVAGPVLAGLLGGTAGVAVAVAASPAFPIGAAGLIETAPGVDLDAAVLGVGWLLVPVAVLLVSAGAAGYALRLDRVGGDRRPSAVATLAAAAGLPVPVVVGTTFALGDGRGTTAGPVRSAVVGAVAGVLGVVGAFTFAHGVADAAGEPARFGQTWQVGAFLGFNDTDLVDDLPGLLTALAEDPEVRAVNDARVGVAHVGRSAHAVTLFTYDPVDEALPTVLTAGRMPTAATEVVLGPTAAESLAADVGDELSFTGTAGDRELVVVGLGFVPASPHSGYADGGWLTPDGYDGLFGAAFKSRFAQVALVQGADPGAVLARLGTDVPGADPQMFFDWGEAFATPVAQLHSVQGLPVALGAFLAVLAVGAVGHALASALRRRRVDVAVLRSLGMTPGQTRALVSTQAAVLAAAGLVIGVPLGLALGRTAWRAVADYTPLHYVPPLAVAALLLAGPVALLVANLLAAWPGHLAARLRIADVLRTE